MSSSPKSSLVERLVQDRLRSGDLEASAAQLLQLGDAAPAGTTAGVASDGQPGPANGEPDHVPHDQHSAGTTRNGATGAAPIVLGIAGMQTAAPLAPVTQSLVTEFPSGPPRPESLPDEPIPATSEYVALELRPLPDPTPPPAPASLFAMPANAPSALVPPPATALPVSAQASITPVREPAPAQVAPRSAPLAAPPVMSQAASQLDVERPDLVQGPPTIDAVALERGGMVDWSRTRSRISEEFRLVQRQILRAAFGPGAEPGFSNLLMVTSARPGEGKSFTSVNLAGSIARQGDHHVLLVDADSKRDSFCYALGLAEMRGLLDLVANPKLDPSPLIVKTPIDRLSILPVGRERERSAELFSTKEMTRLIQSLGRRYADRLLVLDAPPCLSTSDPAVLAPVVGQILFVVEADRTQRDEVEASLDLIQACPNITLVLNKQQISSRYTFGAYSSYYSS
jgi:receptor protein-tyrosine kinase